MTYGLSSVIMMNLQKRSASTHRALLGHIHRAVDQRECAIAVNLAAGLDGGARVVTEVGEVGVRGVQLRDPGDILCKCISALLPTSAETGRTLPAPAEVDVLYVPLGPTAFPGSSQVRLTVMPGEDNGTERLFVISGMVSLLSAVALGLF